MRNRIVLILTLMIVCCCAYSQGFLGQTRAQILLFAKDCDQEGNYTGSMAFKCEGRKILFYFSDKDSLCDLCATDMEPKTANDIQHQLADGGYHKVETKYLEPFLASKNTNHQKFPAQIYSNGKIEYCFMPVSLNGKSTELNAVITKYVKNKPNEKHDF